MAIKPTVCECVCCHCIEFASVASHSIKTLILGWQRVWMGKHINELFSTCSTLISGWQGKLFFRRRIAPSCGRDFLSILDFFFTVILFSFCCECQGYIIIYEPTFLQNMWIKEQSKKIKKLLLSLSGHYPCLLAMISGNSQHIKWD